MDVEERAVREEYKEEEDGGLKEVRERMTGLTERLHRGLVGDDKEKEKGNEQENVASASTSTSTSTPPSPLRPANLPGTEVRRDQDDDATLQLATNTALPPSPGKKSSQPEKQIHREQDNQDEIQPQEIQMDVSHVEKQELSATEPQSQPSLPHEAATSATSASEQAAPTAPEETIGTDQVNAAGIACSTPSTSRLSPTIPNATPPPAQTSSISNETHMKAPTAARQLSTISGKPAATRGRGRPKGSGVRKKNTVDQDTVMSAILGAAQTAEKAQA